MQAWQQLKTDANATYDMTVTMRAEDIAPQVSWGTSPGMVTGIDQRVPDPRTITDENQRQATARALEYMGLTPNMPMTDIKIDKVFIGSCTNARIEDLRLAASLAKGKHVAKTVHAMVVPGSGLVKQQAEQEGLDRLFKEAGFEWREAGCSMCLAMNADVLQPGERCASTSNRNFEGRQGAGGRTHLVSPAMAVAAAVEGHFVDITNAWNMNEGTLTPRSRHEELYATLTLTGLVAPLDRVNVDTDQIIPKQFLKTIKRTGLREGLFYDWRKQKDGSQDPTFFLNQPRFQGATILLTRDNFGCGSSREHAPWALLDQGFRCVIAPSFADIFYNNCFQNGILPVVLKADEVLAMMQDVLATPGYQLTVDLGNQTVTTPDGTSSHFEIDPFRKDCLYRGLDAIGLTLQHEATITSYEARRKTEAPWLFTDLSQI